MVTHEQPEFSVAAEALDDELVVTVTGELDVLTTPELETAIADAFRLHPYTLVIDLSAVTFMDSSGCRALAHARRESFKAAAELQLRGITETGRRTLELFELDKLFMFTESGDAPS